MVRMRERDHGADKDPVINSSSALKGLADEIFAPAKAVMNVLEAVAEMNPAIKVRSGEPAARVQIR